MSHSELANASSAELLRRVQSEPRDSTRYSAELAELRARGFADSDIHVPSPIAHQRTEWSSPITDVNPDSPFPAKTVLTVIGILSLLIGLYFLLLAPGEGEGVVNLQRLTIGETLSICGAVFLAAGMRPT